MCYGRIDKGSRVALEKLWKTRGNASDTGTCLLTGFRLQVVRLGGEQALSIWAQTRRVAVEEGAKASRAESTGHDIVQESSSLSLRGN